ncbi:MAG: hypothetical protein AAGF07_03290 [Patescibacteria group bacterium]
MTRRRILTISTLAILIGLSLVLTWFLRSSLDRAQPGEEEIQQVIDDTSQITEQISDEIQTVIDSGSITEVEEGNEGTVVFSIPVEPDLSNAETEYYQNFRIQTLSPDLWLLEVPDIFFGNVEFSYTLNNGSIIPQDPQEYNSDFAYFIYNSRVNSSIFLGYSIVTPISVLNQSGSNSFVFATNDLTGQGKLYRLDSFVTNLTEYEVSQTGIIQKVKTVNQDQTQVTYSLVTPEATLQEVTQSYTLSSLNTVYSEPVKIETITPAKLRLLIEENELE